MLRQPPDCNRTETLFPYKTRFRSPPGGVTRPFSQPDGSYVVPLIEGDGSRWVRASELARCARARDAGVDPQDLRALGDPDDQLTIPEAARLVGVTSRYLRGLAHYHDEHRDEDRKSTRLNSSH